MRIDVYGYWLKYFLMIKLIIIQDYLSSHLQKVPFVRFALQKYNKFLKDV